MSNYLSQEYRITNPPQLGDVQLARSVMTSLQGRYDAAKSQIDQTLALYNQNLKGLTDSDNLYIAEKLKTVKSQIDLLSKKNGNLAYSYNRDSIMSAVTAVLDDKIVQDAIESRQNYMNANATYQKQLEKDPKSVNDANYQYSLYKAGYFDYMQGKTKKLEAIQFIPYTDYNKKVSDIIMDFETKKDDEVIQIPDGQGGITEITKKGLTPEKIRTIAMYSLDANDNKQLTIDAWANSNMFSDTDVLNNANSYVKNKLEALDVEISDLETKKKQGGTESQVAEWESSIKNKKTEKLNLGELKKDPKSLIIYNQKENFLNSIQNKFSTLYSQTSKEVADEVFWKKRNYELDVAKFQYEQEKDAKKAVTTDAEGLQTITTATVTDETLDNYEKQVNDKVTVLGGELDQDLNAYKSELESLSETNKDAQNILNKYQLALKGKQEGESDLDVFRKVILDGTMNEKNSLAIIGTKNYFSDIKNKTLKYDMYMQGIKSANENGRLEHIKTTLDNKDTFKAFYNNKETKMMWMGKSVPVYKVLQSAGLMNNSGEKTGELTNNKYVLRELQKSYYADDILSSRFSYGEGLRTSKKDSIQSLASSLGESFNSAAKTINIANKGGVQYIINPNSKTGQYLLKAKENGVYDTFSFSDQSLSNDDADISKFVRNDYKKTEAYKKSLERFLNKLPENKVVAVSPTNEETYNSLLGYATSVAEANGRSFEIDKTQGLNIRDISTDYIEVSQNKTTKDGVVPQKIQIIKRDFYNAFPNVASKVNFEGKQDIYTFDNLKDKKLVSSNISFLGNDNTKMYEYATEVLLDDPKKQQLIPYLTDQDTKSSLTTSNASLISRVPEVRNLIDKSVDNSANYSLNIQVTEGFKTPKLHLKLVEISSGKVIHTVSQTKEMLSGISLDEYLEIFNTTPQVLYGTMVNDILRRQSLAVISKTNDQSFVNLVNSLETK